MSNFVTKLYFSLLGKILWMLSIACTYHREFFDESDGFPFQHHIVRTHVEQNVRHNETHTCLQFTSQLGDELVEELGALDPSWYLIFLEDSLRYIVVVIKTGM
eukprot:sb/3478239/